LPIKEDYIKHIQRNFDLSAIQNNTMIAYDAMYGAGQEVMKELFPTLKAFHCEWNPGFNNTPPEPITKKSERNKSIFRIKSRTIYSHC
jgi:phosphomannomutase